MRLLTFNSTNLIPTSSNNIYRLQFPSAKQFQVGDYIALKRVSMYNSVYSIKPQYDNQTFTYSFPVGAGFVTRTVTFPTGTYSVAQLNAYLQSVMVSNGDFLINSQGNYVYYIQLVENPVRYSIQLDVDIVPSALPPFWANGGITFPPVATTPTVTILNNNFTKIIGFNAGTYPAVSQLTAYSKLSDFTPQLSSIFGSILTCNLINNKLANPSSSFNAFAFDQPYGDLLDVDPKRLVFNNITAGLYTGVEIQFLDNDKKPLEIVDTNLLIQLVLWLKDEDGKISDYYIKVKR